MSTFSNNSPFSLIPSNSSTKTKPTDFYLPGLYLNESEIEEENRRFSEFLNNTIEAREYTKSSAIEDYEKERIKEYYETKEDFFRSATGMVSNKTNEVLQGWRLDRTDEPILSITVAGPEMQIFQPKRLAGGNWQMADEFTFAGGSTFGALLDKEANVPQFTEILGRNAQSNYYAAIRARGGKQGELWNKAIQNSTWLQGMLSETDTVKQALDSWIESSPTAFSLKGSIPFSAYFGDTILDILAEAPKPDGWTTEEAIKQLKEADPGLANILFTDMQISEERLKELAQTPLQFKYFIADAIDTYAYQSYLKEYTAQAGFFEEAYSVYAWPLVRDSFNSNDTFSELLVTGGAVALTATGVGAYIGVPILIGKATEKIYRVAKGAERTFDVIESVSRRSGEIAKFNQIIWKSQQFIPSRLTDTVLDKWSVSRNLFKAPKEAGGFRKLVTYGGKQFVGEGLQGLVESGIAQGEAMYTGFQEEFSITDMLYNGVEEGLGGIFLGGPLKGISYGSERIMTTKLGNRINAVIDAGKTVLSNAVELSPRTSSNLDTAVRLMLGIPSGVTIEDFEGAVERRLRLKDTLIRVQNATGIRGLLEDQVNEDDLVQATIRLLSGNDPSKELPARVELIKRIETLMDRTLDPSTNKDNVSQADIETLLFLAAIDAAGNDEAEIAKVNEALWLSRKKREGVVEKDGKPLTIKDATEEELQKIAKDMQEQTTILAGKLGAKDADEISKIFGASLSDSDIKEINNAVEEYEKDQVNAGSTDTESIEYNLPAEGVLKTEINPIKAKEKLTTEEKEVVEEVKPQETTKEEEKTPTVVAPTVQEKAEEFSVNSIVDGMFDKDSQTDEDIPLTEKEKQDLINRVCFRKDI